MRRRTFLAGALGALGASALPPRARAAGPLSAEARALLDSAGEGLDPQRVVDAHVHLVGLGAGGTGCYVNPAMQKPWHLGRWFRYRVYLRAGGVSDEDRADAQYLARLTALAEQRPHGRLLLLALDAVHDEEGRPDLEATEFSTPDAYVLSVARRRPDLFLPGISIHPYRRDALPALEAGAAAGAVLVKWLPSAQRIDPASPRCDAFYARLAELGLPLLVHAGEELAVHAGHGQSLGNPLRLRRALDAGVTVIGAHCATLGEDQDTDAPPPHPRARSFDLFLRMLRERRERGRLLGDLSGVVHYNRCWALPALLGDPALHGQLVNGSDYPLPAVDPVIQLGKLVDQGVLADRLRPALRELWHRDVFAFDLALKRSLTFGGQRLPASCFMPGWAQRHPAPPAVARPQE